MIGANAESLWRRLCHAIDHPELLDDPRYATLWLRSQNAGELDELIGAWVAERDAAEVDEALNRAGVVCAPVYTVADIFADPHFWEREMLVTMADPELGDLVQPGLVPKLSETPGRLSHTGSWQLGAHNQEVFGDLLGVSQAELEELAAEGVV